MQGGSEESVQLVTKAQIICDHGNKFRVGGLSAVVLDGIAEIGIERIDVPSVPCNLDGVANGTLNAGGGRRIFLGDARIQDLRDRVQ